MNESIRKILKLVAEKKISSEDGEKLIREILRHEKKNSEEGDTLNVDNIETGIKNIDISALSTDLTISGIDKDGVDARADGPMTGTQEGDTFFIKSQKADDIIVDANRSLNVRAKILSGDIELNGIEGNLNITTVSGDIRIIATRGGFVKSVSGDIDIREINGNITVKSVSGDIRLNIIDSTLLTVEAISSDIYIELPRNIGTEFNIQSKSGDIDVGFDMDNISKRERGLLIANRGDGHLKLNVNVKSGDIHIKEY